MYKQGFTDLLILDMDPHFCKKSRKKSGKKIISKRNNLKKRKKPGGGSKLRNKYRIKNEGVHAINK
jgi:hypothetical protein